MHTNTATILRTLYNHCLEDNFQHPHMEEAKDLLKCLITIRDIKLFVYDCMGLTEVEGDMKTNKGRIVTARQMAMSLAHKYGKWTFHDIGSEIGGITHSTVISGIKQVENHYDTEKDYKKLYDMIEKSLKQTFMLYETTDTDTIFSGPVDKAGTGCCSTEELKACRCSEIQDNVCR